MCFCVECVLVAEGPLWRRHSTRCVVSFLLRQLLAFFLLLDSVVMLQDRDNDCIHVLLTHSCVCC